MLRALVLARRSDAAGEDLWAPWGRTTVLDPALFTRPVSLATWKSVQGDPTASLTHTNAAIFWLWDSSTDPDNARTEAVLAEHRLRLRNRSLTIGSPPYENCAA